VQLSPEGRKTKDKNRKLTVRVMQLQQQYFELQYTTKYYKEEIKGSKTKQ
jgi:hypothetical protein